MQLRCTKCHMPFAVGKEAIFAALEEIHAEDLSHYNVFCPHCRKGNRIAKKQLKRAAPGWQPGDTVDQS